MFSKYHYLSHNHMELAYQFVAFYNGKPVAFCSILNFPHPRAKNILRVHRLVTLPDYQGIGIGNRLLDFVADYYTKLGKRFRIVTSTPSLAYTLSKNIHWQLKRQGRVGSGLLHNKNDLIRNNKTYKTYSLSINTSVNRITTAWEYI